MKPLRDIISLYHSISEQSYEKLDQILEIKKYKRKTELNNSNTSFILKNDFVKSCIFDEKGNRKLGIFYPNHQFLHQLSHVIRMIIDKVLMLAHLVDTGRYLHLKREFKRIENLIKLNEIASYINITPNQLSRIRKKLYSV